MKKGFTLIELLAVIVILAVILSIAIPSISNIIENAQVQAYHDDEKLIIKAVKTYLGVNDSNLPINVGDTREVTLETLQTNGYISVIKDPKDKSITCDGYVLITKLDVGSYNYEPYLNCENDIGSSTEDGLLVHYTFDDFQEPTTNYVQNGNVSNLTYWQTNPDTTDNISKTLITNDGVGDNTSIEYNVITKNSWGYTSHNLSSYISAGWFDITSQYTLSFYAKRISGGNYLTVYIKDGNGTNIVMDVQTIALTSEWKRYEYTFTPLSTGNLPYVFFNIAQGNAYRIDALQLEKKATATPYVNGSRSGVVKDYSLNNNHANLVQISTPRWTNDSTVGNGSYYFDGVDDYINIGAISENVLRQGKETNDFTLSAWVKPSATQDTNGSLILARQGWHDGLQISTDGRIAFGIFDENNVNRAISSSIVTSDVWHNVVATYTNRTMYLYVDGKLVGTNNYFNLNPTVKFKLITNSFLIGAAVSSFRFKGSIDDARIYERALSADEVKYNYDVLK